MFFFSQNIMFDINISFKTCANCVNDWVLMLGQKHVKQDLVVLSKDLYFS